MEKASCGYAGWVWCIPCFQKRKGKKEVRWKEVGTRAQGSDMSEEEDHGPTMDLVSPSCMLFTVRWHVAASKQNPIITATSLEGAWIWSINMRNFVLGNQGSYWDNKEAEVILSTLFFFFSKSPWPILYTAVQTSLAAYLVSDSLLPFQLTVQATSRVTFSNANCITVPPGIKCSKGSLPLKVGNPSHSISNPAWWGFSLFLHVLWPNDLLSLSHQVSSSGQTSVICFSTFLALYLPCSFCLMPISF